MTNLTRTCAGVTQRGHPCRVTMNLSPSSGLCVLHDPERKAAFQQSGANAPKLANRMRAAADPAIVPAEPKSLEDAVTLAAWITRAVLTGVIDVRVAEAATKAVRQFQLGEEKHNLEQDIKRLQRELDEAKRQTPRPVMGIARG